MSMGTSEPRFKRDVVGGALGFLAAMLMLPLQLMVSGAYIRLLPIVVGGASLCYLLTVRFDDRRELPKLSKTTAHLLPVLTVLILTAIILVAGFQGRTVPFYYMAVWAGTVLFLQVLFVPDEEFHPGVIVGQILLFGLIVRLAALFTTPGYIGIDVWSHVPEWSAEIRAAHSLAPIADEKYYASPLFHLLVIAGDLLLGVSLRHALIFTLGIAMPLAAGFVYAATRLVAEPRWAALAAAVFTTSGHVIEWGIHVIPTSLGLLFFAAVLYTLTRVLLVSSGWRDYLLVVLFSVAVILTHQISSMILLVFVGAGLLVNLLAAVGILAIGESGRGLGSSRRSVNLVGLLVFDLGLVTFSWSHTPYRGATFLETMGSWFVETLTTSAKFGDLAGESGSAVASETLLETIVSYVDALGFLVLLFVAIVGGLAALRSDEGNHATATSTAAVALMLVFVLGFPMFGIRLFVPSRWYAFLVVPMALLAALGSRTLSRRAPLTLALVVLVVFALAFPAVSIISSEASQEAPVFEGTQTRYSYTESELAAVDTLGDVLVSGDGDAIYTDHPYNSVFKRLHVHPTMVAHSPDGVPVNETLLYREYQESGGAFFVGPGGGARQPVVTRAEACTGKNVLYDNGDVALCVEAGGSA